MVHRILSPLLENPRLIFFGLLSTFFSGAGQTFVVSLLTPSILEAFDLSLSQFGLIYMSATLSAAFVIPFLGRLLDRSEFFRFSMTMALLLSFGCLCLSLSFHLSMLFLGFSLIRCFGQGALTLIAQTGVARAFKIETRGKALGLVTLGYPIAEAILPLLVVLVLQGLGWRWAWAMLSLSILIFYVPSLWLLLPRRKKSESSKAPEIPAEASTGWTVGKVLRDYRFYLLQLQTTVTPGILTALFLWQVNIGIEKNWDIQFFATGFIGYAFTSAAVGVLAGDLIDRYGARRLLPLILLPLSLAILVFWKSESASMVIVYLTLCGATVGMQKTVKAAFLANFYGVDILGSTRSLNFFVSQAATAVFPVIGAYLLESSSSSDLLFQVFFAFSVLGCFIGFALAKLYKSP